MVELMKRGFLHSRRSVLQLAAGAAGLALGNVSAASKSLVIEGTASSWGKMQQDIFVSPFRAEHPDVDVVWSGNAGDGVVISKIMLGRGNPNFALANVNTNVGPIALSADCVEAYNPELIPNLRHVAREAVLEAPGIGPYYAASNLGILGLVWNTKFAAKPTSWNDLWSEKYSGKIGIPDFAWLGQSWLPAISRLHGGSEQNPKPGIDAVAELVDRNKAILLKSTDHAMKLFASGAIVMAPFWNGRTLALQRQGVPVAIEYVPNSIFIGDGYLIMNGHKTGELAHRFVNVTLDGEKALGMLATTGYPPSDMRVKLPSEFESARVTASQLSQLVPLDWGVVAKNRDRNLQLWNESIKS